MYSTAGMTAEVSSSWLQFGRLCRGAGHYETASIAILEAQAHAAPGVHIELAKLLWATKKTHRAVSTLQENLLYAPPEVLGFATNAALGGVHVPSGGRGVRERATSGNVNITSSGGAEEGAEHEMDAKTLLLLARWVHHTGQKQKEDVIACYKRVKELRTRWDKGYFYLAKYYDDLLVDAQRRQQEAGGAAGGGQVGPRSWFRVIVV